TRIHNEHERQLRIELLRARSAIERQTLGRSACELAGSLTPSAIFKSLLPRSVARTRPSDVLVQGLGLLRKYPFLLSSLSTLASGVGKRRRWWRVAAGALLSWQVARSLGDRK